MKLKVGDIVEFKKYEDLSVNEAAFVPKDKLPKYGKVSEIADDLFFSIEGSPYGFSVNSVARVISDDVDVNSLKPGDEVLVKATVNSCYDDTVFINPVERFLNKDDVLKTLKHKEPERFIVKEDYYGMYIGVAQELVPDKDVAKIYTSRDTANEDAADMHLNAWDVIHA